MKKVNIIKIGGNIIDNETALSSFLKDFAAIDEPKILVHGGGKLATQMSQKMGIEAQMVDGRRITDAETLKIVTMVYAGFINKNVVAQLQGLGCNALGLSGADGKVIPANKRQNANIDYGFVGDPIAVEINTKLLSSLIDAGISPVLAPITVDKSGQLLNTNADTIASCVATALADGFEVNLCYCFEKNGVLMNPDDDNSVISHINFETFQNLKEQGIISKGMIPKLDNAFNAIKQGVKQVIICHADNLKALIGGTSELGTSIKWD
jgi:acetylglutamate kinase